MKSLKSPRNVSQWRLAGLGVDMAAAVAGFTLLGWFADRQWLTYPRWTVVGAILGLVGGMYTLVRQALAETKRAARATHTNDESEAPRNGTEADEDREA